MSYDYIYLFGKSNFRTNIRMYWKFVRYAVMNNLQQKIYGPQDKGIVIEHVSIRLTREEDELCARITQCYY